MCSTFVSLATIGKLVEELQSAEKNGQTICATKQCLVLNQYIKII